MFFKNFLLIIIFILFSFGSLANEKSQILTQIKNLNSLEFTFNQLTNEKTEKGSCLLEFPGKLKCEYFDDKQKELIINNKKLAITQKRYNKTYHYPISKSPFLNILYKNELLEIIKSGNLEFEDQLIKLVYLSTLLILLTTVSCCLSVIPGKIGSVIDVSSALIAFTKSLSLRLYFFLKYPRR